MFSHLRDLKLEALILLLSSESLPHSPPLQTGTPFQHAHTHLPRWGRRDGGESLYLFPSLGGKEGTKCLGRLLRGAGGGGGKYEPSFSPPPPQWLSLARAAATEAQQRQHSWSACKRKGGIAREGRGAGGGLAPGAPCHPLSARPSAGTCLGHAPQPGRSPRRARAGGGEGAREQEGALHGQVRARRAARILPPPRSAALQVRRQVGAAAAAAHIAGRARRGLPTSDRRRALPAAGAGCGAAARGSPWETGGSPGPGLARASECKRPGDSVRACPRACPPVCASVWVCASV